MLIDITKHKLHAAGVIHVGAHWGQEYETYVKMGITRMVFIEPASHAYSILKGKFGNKLGIDLMQCALGSRLGSARLNIEKQNQGQSNSILEMGTHLTQHPGIHFTETEEVPVLTLDIIYQPGYDLLVIDVQGYEKEVLDGGRQVLKNFKYIYSEVNREDVYRGCARVEEIDLLLDAHGFKRMATQWVGGWGDALYIKKNLIS